MCESYSLAQKGTRKGSLFCLKYMIKTLEEKLMELVAELLVEPEFDSYFLVEIVLKNSKVEVFLDSDTSVEYGMCKKISRHLEGYLDESKALGEEYTLDVSSAGVGKPLKLQRQYLKNVGRDLEVKKLDGTTVSGLLLKASDIQIELETEVKVKEGKKNVIKKVIHEIPFSEIKIATVKIRF